MAPPLPPGSTYRIGDASLVASRGIFKLLRSESVRIQFIEEWAEGNLLFNWYKSKLGEYTVHEIELRKEHKHPFYHEYIALRMGDRFYRLERRQHENEDQPMNSLLTHGVEAYDTIEKILSLDKHLASSSCVAHIDFEDGIHIAVILEICRAIHRHVSAKFYTLQNFNCYFFAQTILLCAARATYRSSDMTHMITHIIEKYDVAPDKRPALDPAPYKPIRSAISPLMLLRELTQIPSLSQNKIVHCSYCSSRSQLLHDTNSSDCTPNLFWDGASQVIQQVLDSIHAGDALQNVLWGTDCSRRLREVYNAFMFWTVCDEWETLQKSPQSNSSHQPVEPGYPKGQSVVGNNHSPSIEHNPVNTTHGPIHGSLLQDHGTRHSRDSSNHNHQRELTDLFHQRYLEPRQKLVELVLQACKEYEDPDKMLSAHYEVTHWPIVMKTPPLLPKQRGTDKLRWLRTPFRSLGNSEMRREKGFKPVHDLVGQLIQAHAKRVDEHPLNSTVLKQKSDEIIHNMRGAMSEIWGSVCAMDPSTSVWES